MNAKILAWTTLLLLLVLSGCASVDVARDAQGTGIAKTYKHSLAAVWDAIPQAISETGGKIIESDQEKGYVFAEYGASAFSWGERVGVFSNRAGQRKTRVEVVSKRAVAVNVTAKDRTSEIFAALDRLLAQSDG